MSEPVKDAQTIGPYVLLESLGEGGMGVVYKAEQTRPVRRTVALKVIKAGMDTRQVVARFEAERQALAVMDHPNIAAIFDAGETRSGRPFFAMEFVDGQPVTDYCDRHRLSLRQRLGILLQICRAVQHAHQKGIVHRDLKPTNILVIEVDGRPVPKVIDFGIAKATGAQLTDVTLVTNYTQLIGTPAYMSPEQADLSGIDVDTRTDIYSLGVLLYEIVTGNVPIGKDRLESAGFAEVQRVLWEEEPPSPSRRLTTSGTNTATIAAALSTTPSRLIDDVRGDLDWIVMKAIDKDRTRRYESAAGLGEDIRRFLNHEPVSATPPSRLYIAKKFVRRHRTGVGVAAALGVMLVVGTVVSTWQAFRIKAANAIAEERAEQSRLSLVRMVESNGLRHFEENDLFQALPWFVRALELDAGHPEREDIHRRRIATVLRHAPSLLHAWRHPGGTASEVLFHPDGQKLFVRHREGGEISVLDTRSGVIRTPVREEQALRALELSADGRWMVGALSNGLAKVWDAESLTEVAALAHGGVVRAAAFDPAGDRLLSAGEDGQVKLWKLPTGELLGALPLGAEVRSAVFAPSGRRIAAAGKSGTARIWDARSLALLVEVPLGIPGSVQKVRFSADGSRLLAFTGNGIAAFDTESGLPLCAPLSHGRFWIYDARFSPDGTSIVSCGRDSQVLVRAADSGRLRIPPLQHGSGVRHASYSGDGRFILTACDDNGVRIWDPATGTLVQPPLYHGEGVGFATYGPEGVRLATLSGHTTRLWSLATAAPAFPIIDRPEVVRAGFDAEARILSVVDKANRLRRYDVRSGKSLGQVSKMDPLSVPLARGLAQALTHPDGIRRVAIDQNSAVIVDTSMREPVSVPMLHREDIKFARFSADGRLLVTGGSDRTARVWDAESGNPITPPLRGDGSVVDAFFSPENALLVTITNTSHLSMWDLRPDLRAAADLALLSRIASEREIHPLRGLVVSDTGTFTEADWSRAAALLREGQPAEDSRSIWFWNHTLQSVSRVGGLQPFNWMHHPFATRRPRLLGQLDFHFARWEPVREILSSLPEATADHQTRRQLGVAEFHLGRHAEAVRHLRLATEANPDDAATWEQLAITHFAIHDVDAAEQAANRAVACNPHAADLREGRATVLAKTGKWDAVLADLRFAASARRAALHAGTEPPAAERIPPRAAEAPHQTIDLGDFYVRTLAHVDYRGDFPEVFTLLPTGVSDFNGTPFDVRGVIRLATRGSELWPFPFSIPGIPIQRESRQLHFLYGLDGRDQPGTAVAQLTMTFADGTTAEHFLTHGRNGADLIASPASVRLDASTSVAWSARPSNPLDQGQATLYRHTWVNPDPEKEIVHLTVTGTSFNTSLLLFGVSAE